MVVMPSRWQSSRDSLLSGLSSVASLRGNGREEVEKERRRRRVSTGGRRKEGEERREKKGGRRKEGREKKCA